MISILKKIVTKLGGVDTSEKNHVDSYTENQIFTVEGEQIASIENGGIWMELQELADYHFMNCIVIGKTKFKTFDGCELIFTVNNESLTLASDSQEIESDFSNVSNRWITRISFDITHQNIEMITNKSANSVNLKFKKNSELFDIVS